MISGEAVTAEQRNWGRLAGLMVFANYLFQGVGDWFTILARSGAPFADTARYAARSPVLWRSCLLEVGISWIAIGVLAFALFVVLAPVDRRLAQLALALRLGASFVGASSLMFRVAQFRIYRSFASETLFTPEQLRMLSSLVQSGANAGVWIAWILQASGTLFFFRLFLRSRLLPRAVAGLGMIGSVMLALASAVMFVFSEGSNWMKVFGLPVFFAELVAAVILLRGLQPHTPAQVVARAVPASS